MKKQNKEIKDSLVKLLREEVSCARALYQALKNESAMLSNADSKLAFISSGNKLKLIEDLQKTSISRIQLMKEHDLVYVPKLIEEYKISSKSNTELDILFIQLAEIAQQCFGENRVIGQLINRRTQFITQTLRSLSPSQSSETLTYEENGSTDGGSDKRNSFFHLKRV